MARVTGKQPGLWEDVDPADMLSSSWQAEVVSSTVNMGTCNNVMIQMLWYASSFWDWSGSN